MVTVKVAYHVLHPGSRMKTKQTRRRREIMELTVTQQERPGSALLEQPVRHREGRLRYNVLHSHPAVVGVTLFPCQAFKVCRHDLPQHRPGRARHTFAITGLLYHKTLKTNRLVRSNSDLLGRFKAEPPSKMVRIIADHRFTDTPPEDIQVRSRGAGSW